MHSQSHHDTPALGAVAPLTLQVTNFGVGPGHMHPLGTGRAIRPGNSGLGRGEGEEVNGEMCKVKDTCSMIWTPVLAIDTRYKHKESPPPRSDKIEWKKMGDQIHHV